MARIGLHVKADTVDDLLRAVLKALLKIKRVDRASRGDFVESIGAVLRLTNPRARLSKTETKGKLFSALGELAWYLAGSDSLEFITHYVPAYAQDSEDGKTIYGAYGPRLFAMRQVNQIENVIKLLEAKRSSRRAVVQMFNAEDISNVDRREIPCTCSLQFLLRRDRLDLVVYMRSNDAFLGLPHDIFTFTMLQELVARGLSAEPGVYHHTAGSLHLYRQNVPEAEAYLAEGWQSSRDSVMPAMPAGDQWANVQVLVGVEERVRKGDMAEHVVDTLPDYWADIARLLQIYSLYKLEAPQRIPLVRRKLKWRGYDQYARKKAAVRVRAKTAEQGKLNLAGNITGAD